MTAMADGRYPHPSRPPATLSVPVDLGAIPCQVDACRRARISVMMAVQTVHRIGEG